MSALTTLTGTVGSAGSAQSLVTALDNRPGDNGAGIMAFFIVAALIVACVVLYRSLKNQLHKIDFEDGSGPADPPDARPSAGSEPA